LLENQPHRPFPHLRRKPASVTHDLILSQDSVSGKPGAVHLTCNASLARFVRMHITVTIALSWLKRLLEIFIFITLLAFIPPWWYNIHMKVKTSISLSSDILEKVQRVTSEGTRSEFIEKAIWYYLDILQRDNRNKRDLDIINESALRLNNEANDILGFQVQL
jgi:hypothetical protein